MNLHDHVIRQGVSSGRTEMSKIDIVDIDSTNVCDFGLCGYKSLEQEGYKRKTEWLKKRFAEGMEVKVLRSPKDGAVGYIEYTPGEYTWRPIEAPGYLTIHCVMIYRKKYKEAGYGSLLLSECLQDAKKRKVNGVAAVTSGGTWMPGSGLFRKHGFESIDTAPPSFDLMVKKMRRGPLPRVRGGWEQTARKCGKGLVIIRSDQCPCIAKFAREITEAARDLGISVRVKELKTCKQAQNVPSAYGIFNLVYDGHLIADHPISKTRFMSNMKRLS